MYYQGWWDGKESLSTLFTVALNLNERKEREIYEALKCIYEIVCSIEHFPFTLMYLASS